MPEGTRGLIVKKKPKMVNEFVNECVSLVRMGKDWLCELFSSLSEAARSISYIETVAPQKADTFHKAIKEVDIRTVCHSYEMQLRTKLRRLNIRRCKLAIDGTEDPYWGKNGVEHTRASVHETSPESWQFVNLAIVEPYFVPLMSLPYKQTDSLDDIVIELLEFLQTLLLIVDLILFDRGFYHAHLIDYLAGKRRGKEFPYLILVPKNEIIKRYIEKTEGVCSYEHTFKYYQDKNPWQPTTTIVVCKGATKDKQGNPIDWCFATNQKASLNLVWQYKKRWNIETGFRIQDEAKIKTKSSHPLIRFFYHMISMFFIVLWRVKRAIARFPIVFKRFLKECESVYGKEVHKPPLG